MRGCSMKAGTAETAILTTMQKLVKKTSGMHVPS